MIGAVCWLCVIAFILLELESKHFIVLRKEKRRANNYAHSA